MRQVVGAFVIQQFCVRLPVQPTGIKGDGKWNPNKACSGWTTTSEQCLTSSYPIKYSKGFMINGYRLAISS